MLSVMSSGVYKRTKSNYNLGRKLSKEHIRKIVETRMKNGSYKVSEATKRKMSENNPKFWLGKHLSKETKIKAVATRMKNGSYDGSLWRGKVGYWKGKKRLEFSKKISGSKNWRWIKDRTKLCRISKQGERRTSIYFNWRKEVWIRDNWKCKINNQDCVGKIIAHHILSWREYPELRYEINNGITLCHAHHPRKRAEEKRLIPIFTELVKNQK